MEIEKKIFVIIILSISILFGLLTIENYGVNETTENNTTVQEKTNTEAVQNTTTQPSSTTGKSGNKTTQTSAKSSNANLSDLGITPHDFTGFKYGTTTYEVTVPEDTETVEVYAKTQQAKATVTGTGKKSLEKGENKVEVVVTAEDGTKKTYTINIIREAQQEEEDNEKEQTINTAHGNGLSELKINNLNLSPEFETNVYEYTVKYIGQDTKLNIETKPTSENYMVEVIGNEDLQEGENIITILVSEENGENVATYQVTVNKSLVDEEAIVREEAEKKEQKQKIMIGVIAAVVILAIIVFIIMRRRRNRNLAEEFSGTYFYDRDEEEEEEYEEEIPRGLREDGNIQMDMEEEDRIEKMPKEKLKEEFLSNYNSNSEEEYNNGYKETIRKKHKGKRFK